MDGPTLIGLHGVKRVGKDTTARFIQDWASKFEPARSVVQRGFADKAKLAFARQFFPLITEQEAIAWVDEYKESDAKLVVEFPHNPGKHIVEVEFRLGMAQFATQGGRQIYGDDHWLDLLLPPERWQYNFLTDLGDDVDFQLRRANYAVITDMRFENELMRIRELGGLNVKIRRQDAEQAMLDEAKRQRREVHDSELGIPDEMFDVVIKNNSNNMDDARRNTYHMMQEIDRNGIASIQNGVPQPWVIGY